jgi:hypothetical protein
MLMINMDAKPTYAHKIYITKKLLFTATCFGGHYGTIYATILNVSYFIMFEICLCPYSLIMAGGRRNM